MSTEERIKIFYLGSGSISVPILEWLRKARCLDLVGIGSQLQESKQEDGPVRTLTTSLIKHCEKHGIPIKRYQSVNTEEFYEELRTLGVEMLVVASFGQILKQRLLDLPPYGCLNVHASLLPKYRGASPIVASLVNGDQKTGVSFMRMEAGLDTGPVYRMVELEIRNHEVPEELENRLGELAGETIEQVIVDIARHGLQPTPQLADGASYAKKINKSDGLVNWREPAVTLAHKVWAYKPWPSLKTRLPARNGVVKEVKITDATPLEEKPEGTEPGEILAYGKEGILVACGTGALRITRVTPKGKPDVDAAAYLLGSPIPPDDPNTHDFPSKQT
ncbi:MAG: methionyl-tRNA formyltransferase [Victivallales bacterium]|nr:methionyl-tRNA formyltransferase [Victivallales bacterium]